ncbi:MAG: PaaI family thioesterase [Tenacibaculum sp.]
MYSRTTGRISYVSEDLLQVKVKIPLSYKNKNYVGSIFGGSLFGATDPIFMIQLINVLGSKYVVWDKETQIKFKRPVYQNAYAHFIFTQQEIVQIKENVAQNQEINLVKEVKITDKDASLIFVEVIKTIYIADKMYYKNKRKKS